MDDDDDGEDLVDPRQRLLNRKQLHAFFDLPPTQVRQWEADGRLQARHRGPGRTLWYRRDEVEELLGEVSYVTPPTGPAPRSTAQGGQRGLPPDAFHAVSIKGELSAQAFEMFEQGHGTRDVVVALKRPMEEVLVLWRDYVQVRSLDAFVSAVQLEMAAIGVRIDSFEEALSHVRRYVAMRQEHDRRVLAGAATER